MFNRTICWGILISFTIAAAGLPSFDIASIRPGSHSASKVDRIDPARFRAVRATLAELIEYAWQVPQNRISGPDALQTADNTFNNDTTMPAATTDEQARLMLRHLLADRFSRARRAAGAPGGGEAL